jgi:CRP-like cAMP-binding protein
MSDLGSEDRTDRLADQLLDLPELAASWQPFSLAAGQPLFAQGDPGDAFYTIIEGRIEVHTTDKSGRKVVLERLGKGEHLGELALVDGGARSAAATALTDCRLRMLDREAFLAALPLSPALSGTTISLLSARMRRNASYIGYVTRWARLVATGDYAAAESSIAGEAAEHADENMARFVNTFVEMIGSVRAREAALKQELQQLRIEIDERKYREQLEEVTESDFFRGLQQSASDMRRRLRGSEKPED